MTTEHLQINRDKLEATGEYPALVEYIDNELKRRANAGRKPSETPLLPLKERNRIAVKKYRETHK